MQNKTIAILYMASGGYINFWPSFYKSCERRFLKSYKKTYFVFTDAKNFKYCNNKNVKVIERPHLGWPNGTLLRYHEFLKHEDTLRNFDYIFFFNANMLIVKSIGEEVLPTEEDNGLVMGQHPTFYDKIPDDYTYDRNPQSTAYIPYGQGCHYVQGCLNGGTSEAFLELCKVCKDNIQKDIDNGVEALWLDESHLNKYILGKRYRLLPPNYLFPEAKWWYPKEWYKKSPFQKDIKILNRDKTKSKYGGLKSMREVSSLDKKGFRFFGFTIGGK